MSSSVRRLSVRWRVLSSCTPPPIVTEIKPLGVFYEAEEYHQNYYALNPAQVIVRLW